MASEVDICNLALTHIRAQPDVISINPAEGGTKAEQCALYYGKARRFVLRAHPWAFALTYRSLALLDDTPPNQWTYAYAVPSDCLRALYVLSATSADPQHFERATADGAQVIYTDVESATLKYVLDVTDPNAFDPQFMMALSFYLASLLAMPIMGDENLAKINFQKYLGMIGQAQATTSYETLGRYSGTHTASWIRER